MSDTEYCKNGHPFDETNTYIYPKTGRRSCRICHRVTEHKRLNKNQENIQKNRDRVNAWRKANPERASGAQSKWRIEGRRIINEAKTKGCFACGEKRLECLDFHHIDRKKKLFNIGLELHKISHQKLIAEIANCQVLCANCHRFITAIERKEPKESK